MYVLVADDEMLIRQSILRTLKQMGITDIEMAVDGIEALEKIKEIRPDIIIADIKMPGMDGLELLEKVRQQFGQILFIFISGYDLFGYAQKAVSLGAFDYLLKPISEENLRHTLSKAIEKLSEQRTQEKAAIQTDIRMREGLEFMRKSFVSELLETNDLPSNYVKNKLKQLNFNMLQELFCVVIFEIDIVGLNNEYKDLNDLRIMKYGIDNISVELFGDQNIIAYPFDTGEEIGYLLNYSSQRAGISPNSIIDICGEVKKYVGDFTSRDVTVGIGTSVDNISSLRISFESARRAISQSIFNGKNKIYVYKNINTDDFGDSTYGFQIEDEMLLYFEKNNKNQANQLINKLYYSLKESPSFTKDDLVKLNFHTIIVIFKILLHFGINPEKLLGDELLLSKELDATKNIEANIAWLEEKISLSMDEVSSKVCNNSRRQVDIAKEYVRENFSNYITLEMVAEYVNLNPSYFSKIFKETTKENFIDFVLDYRLKKAKELLKKGIYKASEISKMVGFNDERYFYKVFKKKTGFTPSEFKKFNFSNKEAK